MGGPDGKLRSFGTGPCSKFLSGVQTTGGMFGRPELGKVGC